MSFIGGNDVINGKEGTAFVTIDGEVKEVAYLKNIEASVEINKADVPMLGSRGMKYKLTGWTGSGSMNVYYVTSVFRQILLDYIKYGKVTYFDVQIKNQDNASTAGKQTVVLRNCLINGGLLSKLDIESDFLDEDIEFSFEDVDMPDKFNDTL